MFNFLKKKLKRNFYEGGDRRNVKEYKNANVPFEQMATVDRPTLVSRARWLHENNGIVANIDNSIVDNAIGAFGLQLKIKSSNQNINKAIFKKFNEWSNFNCDITGRLTFGDMQRISLAQRMPDGEIFFKKHIGNDKTHPFKLQALETERISNFSTPNLQSIGDYNFVDGIELDSFGKPYKYRVLQDSGRSYLDVPSSEMIHYLKIVNRFSQYRGVSEYKQSIVDLRNLAGYQSSVLKSARARANLAYIVETDNIEAHQAAHMAQDENDKLFEINGVFVEYLNIGEKLKAIDPQVVGSNHSDFITMVVRAIAASRQISYELAFRDYSRVNFASARASLIQDHKRFDHEQYHITSHLLNVIYWEWLEINVIEGNIKGLSVMDFYRNRDDFKPFWIPPKREWVDPLKDIKAFEMELNLNASSLTDYLASKGQDIDELIEERRVETEKMKQAGILTEEAQNG